MLSFVDKQPRKAVDREGRMPSRYGSRKVWSRKVRSQEGGKKASGRSKPLPFR